MREIRYLWREPVRMSNERLKAVLGHEPHTPLDEAVEAAQEGMGCLVAAGPVPEPRPARCRPERVGVAATESEEFRHPAEA